MGGRYQTAVERTACNADMTPVPGLATRTLTDTTIVLVKMLACQQVWLTFGIFTSINKGTGEHHCHKIGPHCA